MARISESVESRKFTLGGNAVRELVYNIFDAADEDEAATILGANAPSTYLGLSLDSLNADPIGPTTWKGYARYIRLSSNNEQSFSTKGRTKRVTQSIVTVGAYAPPGMEAPDFYGAIGVSDDKVEGVEVPDKSFSFSETHYFDPEEVTDAFKRTLADLTGTMCDASFRSWALGEVLLLGVEGTQRGDEKWAIKFDFDVQPNQYDIEIGGAYSDGYIHGDGSIIGISKLGWDYVWVRYAEFEDSFAYSLVKRPVAAYVERVVEFGDFSLLGIG